MPKPIIANCVPKLVAMTTSLSTYGPLSNTIPTAQSEPTTQTASLSVQTTAECPYTLLWDAHSPLKICPFPWGIWTPI